jgi:signal peptidase II
MTRLQPREIGLIAAAAGLAADQGSKLFMLYALGFVHMPPGENIPVLPFFNLVMVWNPGISYGLLAAIGTPGLIALTMAGLAGLTWWLWHSTSRALASGFGLVIGGGLGNLIDRLLYGRVADFFHFYGFGYDWYVFNIADIAITLGAVAIVYEVLKPEHPHTT